MVADPLLLCAVINPPLLTVSALVLSDCQFVQVAVTSCVVPLAKMPIAVTCAVAPAFVKEEKSAEKEKMTTWTVGVGVGVGLVVELLLPHADPKIRSRTTQPRLNIDISAPRGLSDGCVIPYRTV
jgi:hypothetical protein